MMPTFDWTIHVSDVVVFVAGLIAFVRVFMTIRDTMRDVSLKIGTKAPPDGLLGDVVGLQHETRKHRDRLIALEVETSGKVMDRT